MTRADYDKAREKIKQFDQLSRNIDDIDSLVRALECEIKEVDAHLRSGVSIELTIGGETSKNLVLTVEQAEKVQEMLVSYSWDVRKHQEEL